MLSVIYLDVIVIFLDVWHTVTSIMNYDVLDVCDVSAWYAVLRCVISWLVGQSAGLGAVCWRSTCRQ